MILLDLSASVSPSVHSLVTPCLWTTVKIILARLKDFLTDAALKALARNAEHVRDLEVCEDLYDILLPRMGDEGDYHPGLSKNLPRLRHICKGLP